MRICPITYELISDEFNYSKRGLRQLSTQLKDLHHFPLSAEEQRREAEAHSSKLSIQGVQPKMSASLNVKESIFQIVDQGGKYILKPQVERYPALPENEDLTMRLASLVKIEVPLHGLIYSKDGSYTYFIRRFDRIKQKGKLHVEDFAQLSQESRNTKYDSTMERVAKVIEDYCTFPVIEKLKLFRQTLFSFLIGNEDMHLKNFSIIVREGKVELSPAYDLVNSTLVITSPQEELALPIRGRKNRLLKADLIDYFASERLKLTPASIQSVLSDFNKNFSGWRALIEKSFLPKNLQEKYLRIIENRASRMDLNFVKTEDK